MPIINLPYPTPQYIIDQENVEAVVANRPNIQIQENVLSLKANVEANMANILALMGMGEEYDPNKNYVKYAIVKDDDDVMYQSQQPDNQGNPLDDVNWWKIVDGTGNDVRVENYNPSTEQEQFGTFWVNSTTNELFMQTSTDKTNPYWRSVGGGSGDGSSTSVLTFNRWYYTGDGSTSQFEVHFDQEFVDVYLNGAYQYLNLDYTLDSNKSYITFNSTPVNGDNIELVGWQRNIDPNLVVDCGEY